VGGIAKAGQFSQTTGDWKSVKNMPRKRPTMPSEPFKKQKATNKLPGPGILKLWGAYQRRGSLASYKVSLAS
jgi:hypothetical protein